MILFGDCKEKLKELDDDSIDAAVTDPPYELGFMGKKWDASGIAYNVELWKECLRVLKPGGHLLSFGGTRTYHRMAVAIEDAGFEIRDMLEWIYASGFPKSQNVGKAFDKKMGNEREITKEQKLQGTARRMKGGNYNDFKGEDTADVVNITKGNSQWEGFGTALKPAHEPIVLARKPLSEKTIVENCIKHGAGALDIDGCRIPINDSYEKKHLDDIARGQENATNGKFFGGKGKSKASNTDIQGRFPANLAVTDDALNDGTITKSTGGDGSKFNIKNRNVYNKNSLHPQVKKGRYGIGLGDSGSKSRYFDIDVWGENHGLIQTPKASKSERNAGCEDVWNLFEQRVGLEEKSTGHGNLQNSKGMERFDTYNRNNHPTVKPLHLISWLVRLVSKERDTVLDPFMGSGTTGVACKQLNRNFIGIESNEEYIKIAEKRIAHRNFLWRWYR